MIINAKTRHKKVLIASYVTDELFNAIDEDEDNWVEVEYIEMALEHFTGIIEMKQT